MNRKDLVNKNAVGSILDVGAGDCIFIWDKKVPPNVTTFDIDYNPLINVIGSATQLPFRDKSFNTVLLLEILEHIDNIVTVVSEAIRVAQDKVIISYPHESRNECKQRRDMNTHIKTLENEGTQLNKAVGFDEEGNIKSHFHWKTEERIFADIEFLQTKATSCIELDYGLYKGWGFIIENLNIKEP